MNTRTLFAFCMLLGFLAASPAYAEEKKTAEPPKEEKKEGRPAKANDLYFAGTQLAQEAEQALADKKEGEYQRMTKLAMEKFEKALELAPDDGEIMNSLGAQYFNTGQIEKAVATYKKAVAALKKANNRDSLGLAVLNLAGAYYAQGKYDLALKEADSALGFDPDNELAKKIKADCQELLKKK